MACCSKCGKSISEFSFLKYYVPDEHGVKHTICKDCSVAATRSGRVLKWDESTRKVILVDRADAEIKKMCRNCGHIMCYTPLDLENNRKALSRARWNAIGALGGAMNGRLVTSALNNQSAQNELNQIRDYNRCPMCGSIDLETLTKEQYEAQRYYRSAGMYQMPYPQAPVPQMPYPQAPVPQMPYPQAPVPQAPIQQMPYPQAPYLQAPYPQAPYPQAPIQQAPIQQAPYPQAPVPQKNDAN